MEYTDVWFKVFVAAQPDYLVWFYAIPLTVGENRYLIAASTDTTYRLLGYQQIDFHTPWEVKFERVDSTSQNTAATIKFRPVPGGWITIPPSWRAFQRIFLLHE
jgi:hypothetical protein